MLFAVLACVLLIAGPARGQLTTYSIPGDIGWAQAQQIPFSERNYFQLIDFDTYASTGAIAPKDTVDVIAVPELPDSASVADLTVEQQAAFGRFAARVSRDSVLAVTGATLGGRSVRPGDLLVAARENFPRSLAAVQLMRAAGVDSVRAMVDLAHAVLFPRDPQRRFETLLNSPTLYETQLTEVQQRTGLESMIDHDPMTAFVRIDQPNRRIEKRAVVIRMDLVGRFPVGLIRFYPRPRTPPLRVTAFQLDINDGVDLRPTQATNTRTVTPFDYEILGDQVLPSRPGLPNYTLLRIDQGNQRDTVGIALHPPRYIRYLQWRSLTGLDYDIASLEVYNEGYPPTATWVSRPLPLDKGAIPNLVAYQGGDGTRRALLDALPGATLGRIRWDEQSIGDPGKAKVEISFQTGISPEPLILFRLNKNGDAVEWRADAQVQDRRGGTLAPGQLVNLDDPLLRSSARDIWNALSDAERAAAQTTQPEYALLTPANREDRNSFALPRVPDAVTWSGFQPVSNGQLLTVPGERPFFQLRIRFTSEDYRSAKAVGNLRFETVLPPLLPGVTAEIVPATGVRSGQDTLFTYLLRPRLGVGGEGFDHVRISTPAPATIERVRYAYGTHTVVQRSQDVAYKTKATTDSFVVFQVPPVDATMARGDSLIVLVDVRGRVLSSKTTFAGFVFRDTLDTSLRRDYSAVVTVTDDAGGRVDTVAQFVPQRVQGGDVLALGETEGDRNTLDVVTSIAEAIEDVVARLEVTPVFTPNGDAVNDVAEIRFDVLRVLRPVPVRIDIDELSGRRMRSWTQSRRVSAVNETWDGLDGAGHLVPPGTYVVRVTAETDERDWSAVRVVSVVY